jgi:hypothetical protein
VKVEALYPLSRPQRFDADFHFEAFEGLINYLNLSHKLRIRGSETHDGEELSVSLLKSTDFLETYYPTIEDPLRTDSTVEVLRVEGCFEFPGKEDFVITDGQTGHRVDYTEDQLHGIWASLLPNVLDLTIQTYLCSLTIAFPGAARVWGSIWLVDGHRHRHSSHHISTLHEGVGYLTENEFYPAKDIAPERVHSWVCAQNGMFDGYSDTPAGRALNYFTRLFVRNYRNDELSDLVWALAGIEALLVNAGRSSQGQLKEKLGALFDTHPRLDWLRTMTDRMYQYRSKMVHGNRQIKSAFRHGEDDSDKRFYEEYDSARFAVGILLVLLQEVIKRSATTLRFKTVLADDHIGGNR